ncbi:MAG: hypothetical protein ABIN89_19145 [Chitinophagaceae bacterium]
MNADVANEADFFSNASYPDLHIDSSVYPFVFLDEDSKKYIFSGEGSVLPEFKMYYAPVAEMNALKIIW